MAWCRRLAHGVLSDFAALQWACRSLLESLDAEPPAEQQKWSQDTDLSELNLSSQAFLAGAEEESAIGGPCGSLSAGAVHAQRVLRG